MVAYRRVIIESPYRASTPQMAKRNVAYMIKVVQDSINRGEAPFLSHLMYTGALDDSIPLDRQLGIDLGYAWWSSAEAIVFYTDYGWTIGMVDAKLRAEQHRMVIEERYIAQNINKRPEPELPESQ